MKLNIASPEVTPKTTARPRHNRPRPTLPPRHIPIVLSSSLNPQPATVNSLRLPASLPFSLRKGLGFWDLTFEGQSATFKHEQGAYYVAHLLLNPPAEPVHGFALALKIKSLYQHGAGDLLPRERSLGLEDAEALAALRRKQLQLEAILDDDDQIEPIKAEATRELEEIYAFQKKHPNRVRDTAQKAVHTVRTAILRFHSHLANATGTDGSPHPVLGPFADHLKQHLLIPSGRYSKSATRVRAGLAGCFTYQPPTGVTWTAL